MYDLHSHILPGLDDGAQSMQDTLLMAAMAARYGTKEMVCTPHCSTDDPNLPQRLDIIIAKTRQANAVLYHERIPVRLHPGMEFLCTENPSIFLERGDFLTLAGSRYLLIEFSFDIRSSAIQDAASTVARYGLTPIIAHPERYDCVQWTPELVRDWVSRGWLIQINRGSLTGNFGQDASSAAQWILNRRLAHLVASDAHGIDFRTPDLAGGYRWVLHNCDKDYADLLFRKNPRRILSDRSVETGVR